MGFTSFLKTKNTEERWSTIPSTTTSPTSPSSWSSWPSCKHPKTLSFRAEEDYDREYSSESWFTTSSEDDTDSLSSMMASDDESLDTIVHGITSKDRILSKPSMNTKSILEESKAGEGFLFKDDSVIVVDSGDAYSAFKLSMEEMVAEHALENVEGLQELVEWYLKVNGEERHDVIVEAFVDLVFELFTSNPSFQ